MQNVKEKNSAFLQKGGHHFLLAANYYCLKFHPFSWLKEQTQQQPCIILTLPCRICNMFQFVGWLIDVGDMQWRLSQKDWLLSSLRLAFSFVSIADWCLDITNIKMLCWRCSWLSSSTFHACHKLWVRESEWRRIFLQNLDFIFSLFYPFSNEPGL